MIGLFGLGACSEAVIMMGAQDRTELLPALSREQKRE